MVSIAPVFCDEIGDFCRVHKNFVCRFYSFTFLLTGFDSLCKRSRAVMT